MKQHTFRFDYLDSLQATTRQMVMQALAEDLNTAANGGDITAALIPKEQSMTANLISRESGILCGTDWFSEVFKQLDREIIIDWYAHDGDTLSPDGRICQLQGCARNILTGERTAMNFLQTLSGTATLTAEYVAKIASTSCRLLDTRKTIPGFRLAQKYAVTCGGGHNHRIGLFDAFLIKENHIIACGSIHKAVALAKATQPGRPVEVEVEDIGQFIAAVDASADIIMLDNFNIKQILEAVALNSGKVTLEASGNISLDSIFSVAKTGVDYVSVGALTKNVIALDLSLRLITDG